MGISFEFWENLVLRYLKDPNFHDEEIFDAIANGAGGLDFADFSEKKGFYLSLTAALKKEEWVFYEQSLYAGFLPYNENEDISAIIYPVRRFCNPTYRFVNNHTDFMVFDEIWDPELRAAIGESDCTFHEPKVFRACHSADDTLSIDSCRGITTRRVPAQVHLKHHLKWIAEYANACENCQSAADSVIRDFAGRGLTAYHRPYYHPAFFAYRGRQIQDWAIPGVCWYSHFEEGLPSYGQYELRPSKGEFFAHLVEHRDLWANDPTVVVPPEFLDTASTSEDEDMYLVRDEDMYQMRDEDRSHLSDEDMSQLRDEDLVVLSDDDSDD